MTIRATPTDWDERYLAKPSLWGIAPNRFVEARCSDLPAGVAVDLACGEGRNALWLVTRGWQVTAIDFSPVAIERARAHATEHSLELDLRLGDIITEPLDPGGYDLVLLAYVHLPPVQRAALLTRARDAVRSGGRLLLVGHDLRNLEEGHGGPTDPSVLWTADEVVAALVGLEIVEAGVVTRRVEGAARDAIDTLVEAVRPTDGAVSGRPSR